MAGTFVQSASSASNLGGGATAALQFSTQNTGAGNLLVAIVQCFPNTSTLTSVTDSQNNTWVVLPNIGGSTYNFYLAYALNTAGGTEPTVTFHYSASTTNVCAVIAEYSGVNTFRAAATGATAAGTTVVTNNVSAVIGDLLIGYAMAYTTVVTNSWTLGAGFSNLETCGASIINTNNALENASASSTGSANAAFTAPGSTANWWAGIAAFYQVNASGSQGNSPMGNVIFDLDSGGFPIAELQTGTDA